MKFFGIVAFVLSSAIGLASCLFDDGIFYYDENARGTCSIIRVYNSFKGNTIWVPPSAERNGHELIVSSVKVGTFYNTKGIETINFESDSSITSDLYLEDNAFGIKNDVKKINLYNEHVTAHPNAFFGVPQAKIDGKGVKNFVRYMANQLLFDEWKLEKSTKMANLYKVAKLIRKNFTINYGDLSDNLANILTSRKCSVRGMHMLFRELAIAMGVNEDDILTVGDKRSVYWNYFRYENNKWYNVEIYMFDYESNGDSHPVGLFQTNDQFVQYLKDQLNSVIYSSYLHASPSKWYVFDSRYGTDYEGNINKSKLIDAYLKNLKNPGTRA